MLVVNIYEFYKINYIHNSGLQIINSTNSQDLGKIISQNAFWKTEVVQVFGKLLFAKRIFNLPTA